MSDVDDRFGQFFTAGDKKGIGDLTVTDSTLRAFSIQSNSLTS